jgi:hypothetical protein
MEILSRCGKVSGTDSASQANLGCANIRARVPECLLYLAGKLASIAMRMLSQHHCELLRANLAIFRTL